MENTQRISAVVRYSRIEVKTGANGLVTLHLAGISGGAPFSLTLNPVEKSELKDFFKSQHAALVETGKSRLNAVVVKETLKK